MAASETIGTYTDPDGNVETEVEEPESIPLEQLGSKQGLAMSIKAQIDQTKIIPLLTKAPAGNHRRERIPQGKFRLDA